MYISRKNELWRTGESKQCAVKCATNPTRKIIEVCEDNETRGFTGFRKCEVKAARSINLKKQATLRQNISN